MSREQLRSAAEQLNRARPSAPADQSAFELSPTSPRTELSADSTQSTKTRDGLETNELVAILVSIPLPGIGHVLLGQRTKGIVIFVSLFVTLGLLYLVALGVAFDAFLVVRASRKREVGKWEFFPDFGDLLS